MNRILKKERILWQLTFSKALIAYRLGLDRQDLMFIEGATRRRRPRGELLKLALEQIGADKVSNYLQLLEGSSYGINIAEDLGFQVACGRTTWILFLNNKSIEGDIKSSLSRQKMLTGLLACRGRETGTYAVQYVVLTQPYDPSTIQIMIVRTDSEISYSGNANVENGTVSFTILDVERSRAAPTHITGKLSRKGAELGVSSLSSRRKEKRRTKKLTTEVLKRLSRG